MIEDILLLSMIYILLFIINFPSPLSMTHLLFFKCSVFDFDLYSVTSFPTNSYLINFSKKNSSKNLQPFSRKKKKKKKKKITKKFCINPLFPFNHQLLMFEIWPRNVFPSFLMFLKKEVIFEEKKISTFFQQLLY